VWYAPSQGGSHFDPKTLRVGWSHTSLRKRSVFRMSRGDLNLQLVVWYVLQRAKNPCREGPARNGCYSVRNISSVQLLSVACIVIFSIPRSGISFQSTRRGVGFTFRSHSIRTSRRRLDVFLSFGEHRYCGNESLIRSGIQVRASR
jgi:hypothetical protein